ncbi:MAG: NAD(P)/FAD-dependent oxidoreductase [Akkermansiaceae bacterium]
MKGIVIAGGGLAGLSLGIALVRKGVPVTIREAGQYPRHRVCGEFVNGVTMETLRELGIAPLFQGALEHRSTKWWVGEECVLKASLPRPALGMSRWEMDELLRIEFEKEGGELRTGERANCRAQEGLVWTAGRRMKKNSSLLGLKAHFEDVDLDGSLEMHLGKNCYLGLTPVNRNGSRVNVCGLFNGYEHSSGGNPLIRAIRQDGLHGLADRLEEGRMDDRSLTGISGIELGGQRVEDDLCVLGDAERMIPPFTGNGMSMAFESAECAVVPLMAYCREERSWNDTRQAIALALENRFRDRVNLAVKLHHCLMHPAGRVVVRSAARSGLLPFHWLHRRLS